MDWLKFIDSGTKRLQHGYHLQVEITPSRQLAPISRSNLQNRDRRFGWQHRLWCTHARLTGEVGSSRIRKYFGSRDRYMSRKNVKRLLCQCFCKITRFFTAPLLVAIEINLKNGLHLKVMVASKAKKTTKIKETYARVKPTGRGKSPERRLGPDQAEAQSKSVPSKHRRSKQKSQVSLSMAQSCSTNNGERFTSNREERETEKT